MIYGSLLPDARPIWACHFAGPLTDVLYGELPGIIFKYLKETKLGPGHRNEFDRAGRGQLKGVTLRKLEPSTSPCPLRAYVIPINRRITLLSL